MASYPKQPGAYPRQAAPYPQQAQPYPQQPYYPQSQDPPPSYYQSQQQQHGAPPPAAAAAAYPQQHYSQPLPQPVPMPVATFSPNASVGNPGQRVNIPPPPPGYAPMPAQVAAAQGQPVMVQQGKKDLWFGGTEGGATFF